MLLDADDQRRLLNLARRCLEARVRRQPQPAVEYDGALDLCRGAFVSIHGDDDLRGCLGCLETDRAATAISNKPAASCPAVTARLRVKRASRRRCQCASFSPVLAS